MASDKSGVPCRILERQLRPWSDLLDHKAGGEAAELAADIERLAIGIAMQEACRVEIAGAGGVDHLFDVDGVDVMALITADNDGSVLGTGDRGKLAVLAQLRHGMFEIVGLVE